MGMVFKSKHPKSTVKYYSDVKRYNLDLAAKIRSGTPKLKDESSLKWLQRVQSKFQKQKF